MPAIVVLSTRNLHFRCDAGREIRKGVPMTDYSAITNYRLALQAAGFSPIPALGKKVLLWEWQTKHNVSPEEIISWGTDYPHWANTSELLGYTAALDDDITQPDAADAVDRVTREWFDGRGTILTRFGAAPKRAVLFRTSTPFTKKVIHFVAPDGKHHRVEMLGKGQQLVLSGVHPTTGKHYSWHAGLEPGIVPCSDLPEIGEQEADEFLDYIAAMLAEEFGFQRAEAPPGGNGTTAEREAVEVAAEIETIADGASANAVQVRIIPSLLRKGEHPQDVLEYVVDATMEMAARHGLAWTREAEVKAVIRRILSGYNNLLLADYDPATGVIPSWLPGEFHEKWIALLEAGRKPAFGFNRGGFYLRSTGQEHAAEAASVGAPSAGASASGSANDKAGAKSKTSTKKPAVLELLPFTPFDVATLPPRSWLYGKHYQRCTVALTAGPGGMGKSSLDMVEAIAMATCRNLLGEQPEARLRIWYHNGEDPRDEINRRLAAICQHYRIPQQELQGYLWTTSGTEFPLRVAKGYTNLEVNDVLVRQISAAIGDNQIDVAIFDPLVTLHSVSEVDSGKMDTVVRLFAGIADENDAAIEIAHHVRKPAAGSNSDYDVHDIRGVAAITDAVRAARVLNRMNEKDAEAAGCSEVERLSRFRVDRAKGNYSPAQAATWRQFANVELINGNEVGVVAQWNFPGQGEHTPEKAAADQKAERLFLQLLDKFTAQGINVSPNSGSTYAPARFAEEREAKAAKVSKAALKAAMGRLLDTNRIRNEPSPGRADGRSHRLVVVDTATP